MFATLAQQGVAASLHRRLASLSERDTRRWGTMSVGEMLRHLTGAFRMAVGELPVTAQSMPIPPGLLKTLALWAPIHWRRNLPTVPELVRAEPASADFLADRSATLSAMQTFLHHRNAWPDHPFFGAMSTREWMRWGYLHTDHHLRQFGR